MIYMDRVVIKTSGDMEDITSEYDKAGLRRRVKREKTPSLDPPKTPLQIEQEKLKAQFPSITFGPDFNDLDSNEVSCPVHTLQTPLHTLLGACHNKKLSFQVEDGRLLMILNLSDDEEVVQSRGVPDYAIPLLVIILTCAFVAYNWEGYMKLLYPKE
jgi:hypothetical protein